MLTPDRTIPDTPRARIGALAFVCFLVSIPLANWMIHNIGTVCVPNGPCLVPVAPAGLLPTGWGGAQAASPLMAPSGVLVIGVALVLRDVVQRCLGLWAGLAAIAVGSVVSGFIAPGSLVIASCLAFLLSELADCAVYTPLQRRRLVLAVVASSVVGLVVDSLVFLWLAFGSLAFLPGQIVGKLWAVLFAVPLVRLLRRAVPTPA